MSVNRARLLRFGWAKQVLIGTSMLSAVPVMAQNAPASAPAPSALSDSAMGNLVRLLVKQHLITEDQGKALVTQAEEEALQARAAATSAQQAAAGQLPPPPEGAVRVPYVPETVRAQIKDELRGEVMAQARTEGWAAPSFASAEWTRNIRLYGDIRVRTQSDLYSKSNSNLIFDFARINAEGPTDVLNDPLPILNATKDRWSQMRLRARIGIDARVNEHLQAGLQLATGGGNSPISTNASLGGGFAKRDIWLQEAWFRLASGPVTMTAGRFPNPFVHTELLFDQDLAFDGIASSVDISRLIGTNRFGLSLRGGAFPLDFGDPDFPSTESTKRNAAQKYLFSAQLALDVPVRDDLNIGIAAAYHNFVNVQGDLSQPCAIYLGVAECSTDNLRPFFMQKGNTLSPLRQIAADPSLPAGQVQPQPQFFGLTLDYDVLDVNASVTYKLNKDIQVGLFGNYVRNLAFKSSDLCRNGLNGQPFNNGEVVSGNPDICAAANPARFVGGKQGYLGKLVVGHREVRRLGQWNAEIGYRYLQSDAVLDSFTDSDFHLGGTNAKGYFVGANVGLYDGMTLGGRWLSASKVSGEPFSIDVLQIDLQVAF